MQIEREVLWCWLEICIKMIFENSQLHVDTLTLYLIVYVYIYNFEMYNQNLLISILSKSENFTQNMRLMINKRIW